MAYLTSPGLTSASWSRAATSYPFSWGSSGSTLNFNGFSGNTAYQQRDGIFNLSATTVCGNISGQYKWPVIVQGWSSFNMTVSPNPAVDVMTLIISEESPNVKALDAKEIVQLELIDVITGQPAKQWKFKNNQRKFILNVGGLKKGQYILRAAIGKYQESKQVIVGR